MFAILLKTNLIEILLCISKNSRYIQPSVFSWCHPHQFPELFGVVAWACKAIFKGHIGHRGIAGQQLGGRGVEPFPADIFHGAVMQIALKNALTFPFTDADAAGKLGNTKWL